MRVFTQWQFAHQVSKMLGHEFVKVLGGRPVFYLENAGVAVRVCDTSVEILKALPKEDKVLLFFIIQIIIEMVEWKYQ